MTLSTRAGLVPTGLVARAARHWLPLAILVIVAAPSLVLPAAAHHSFSPFDLTTEKTITGVVVEFEWTNPHTWTWVNVDNDDGTVTKWGLEGMSPNFLGRRCWSKNTFAPGDVVQIVVYPLKSGEPGGTFVRATLADGTVRVMFGGPPG
jgi:hypothetical protein